MANYTLRRVLTVWPAGRHGTGGRRRQCRCAFGDGTANPCAPRGWLFRAAATAYVIGRRRRHPITADDGCRYQRGDNRNVVLFSRERARRLSPSRRVDKRGGAQIV